MAEMDSILKRIASGTKVRIIQDRYGQERIEFRRSWLPFKTRLALPREDMAKIKEVLGVRGGRKDRPVIPVTF